MQGTAGAWRKAFEGALRISLPLVSCGCSIYLAFRNVINHVKASGPSMSPALDGTDETIVFERTCTWVHSPRPLRRGDVIVARMPHSVDGTMTKRILGLPGDMLQVTSSGAVAAAWIRGAGGDNAYRLAVPMPAPSPAAAAPAAEGGDTRIVVVPPGHAWLQGDNLHVSIDSREYGPIPLALVLGRAVATVWPTEQAGPIPSRVPLITAVTLLEEGRSRQKPPEEGQCQPHSS